MGETGKSDARQRNQTRFWLSVLRLHSDIFAELNKRMQDEVGLSLAKFDAMAQLARTPEGISMGQLSSALKVSNGNVSGLVTRLIKDGLVIKAMSTEDRRSFSARLTEIGEQKFLMARDAHNSILADILQQVPDEELTAANTALREILEEMHAGDALG
ncbi:MarR family winged helix-turn-helix transcriptional regulator [Nioella sediminis]|jgi:DNA-binding MarR family transcriptional regulator|uniref:MarR family winged helix-turn-helix transcriptional regulator n=1 Tax=Nioella sediminis TaxID=1912092 RepID=UPI0008FD256F|nr:MarR family transcriptional regulator [Nioella sediminis]TBX14785.1 MarR family transcriptional regulator [Roseovarius sp. JS7-11]